MTEYHIPPVWLLNNPTQPDPPLRHRHNDCWCGTTFHPIPRWPELKLK